MRIHSEDGGKNIHISIAQSSLARLGIQSRMRPGLASPSLQPFTMDDSGLAPLESFILVMLQRFMQDASVLAGFDGTITR
jgi:hypothetical protein